MYKVWVLTIGVLEVNPERDAREARFLVEFVLISLISSLSLVVRVVRVKKRRLKFYLQRVDTGRKDEKHRGGWP